MRIGRKGSIAYSEEAKRESVGSEVVEDGLRRNRERERSVSEEVTGEDANERRGATTHSSDGETVVRGGSSSELVKDDETFGPGLPKDL